MSKKIPPTPRGRREVMGGGARRAPGRGGFAAGERPKGKRPPPGFGFKMGGPARRHPKRKGRP